MKIEDKKLVTGGIQKSNKIKEITVPKSFYAGKILDKEIKIESNYYDTGLTSVIVDSWNKQHPLMHTWLLLSSVSICFLSAIFFIVQ